MLRTATQQSRQLAVFTPFGPDVLLLESFTGSESLSRLSHFELRMLSADPQLDPARILGQNVSFLVDHEDGPCRYFNGFVSSFALVDVIQVDEEQLAVYHAEVVPWLWLLSNTCDCRIFQNLSTPEIVSKIIADLGFASWLDTSELTGNYDPREYCVQYRESDLDFVLRLLEEEGIFFYFRHENGKHTLVLADSTASYFEIEADTVSVADRAEQGVLSTDVVNWRHGKRAVTGAWAATDYNPLQPETDLGSTSPSAIPALNALRLEQFDYPGRFNHPGAGRKSASIRIGEQEARHEWVSAEGFRATFTPGGLFEVVDHPNRTEEGRRYAIRKAHYMAGSVGGYTTGEGSNQQPWYLTFEALPEAILFRPDRMTPRPIVEGPQTAMVVGPAGEEIHTDEHGRIKVQFHWDREGSLDENSSCWIRVSQVHAGAGWGAMHIPRIGEEVIVSFLEGDPDRPIVKGRVYNAVAPAPFALPDEMTRSGGKSNTHKGSGYNEISMDDTAGKEQMQTNAQHNMDTTVGNNQTLAVGVDRSSSIGNNDSLTVGVDSQTEVGNDSVSAIGNNSDEIVGNHVVINAGTAITLKCGMSTIHMNQAGVITISGQFVSSLAAGCNTIIAPMVEIAGSTMLNQAGAICLDIAGIKHIKGGQTSISGGSVNVKGGVTVIKGAPIKLGEAGAPIVAIPVPPPAGSGAGSSSGPPGGISETNAKALANAAYETEELQRLKDAGKPYESTQSDGTKKAWEILDVQADDDGFKAAVFKDPATGQVVVAFGGTDFGLSDLSDWDDNLIQVAGGIPPQYQKANALVGDMKERYGDKLVVTGHSLGGGLANFAAGMHDVPGVGFNSAPLGWGTQKAIARSGLPGSTDNFVHYNNQRDLVSSSPGKQLGTIVTHINDKGYSIGSSHGLATIDTNDPIMAEGPLSDRVYQEHWNNALSRPSVAKPG